MLGASHAVQDSLRSVAHLALAELLTSEKDNLTFAQVAKVVHLFSKNILDQEVGSFALCRTAE